MRENAQERSSFIDWKLSPEICTRARARGKVCIFISARKKLKLSLKRLGTRSTEVIDAPSLISRNSIRTRINVYIREHTFVQQCLSLYMRAS